MKYYVYMLWSIKNAKVKTYVGYTINLKKRLDKHNAGIGAKSTRGRVWKIIYNKKYKSRSLALKAEYILKKDVTKRKKISENIKKK
jgi:putative endonuclease